MVTDQRKYSVKAGAIIRQVCEGRAIGVCRAA
jgi:hypothetical protein